MYSLFEKLVNESTSMWQRIETVTLSVATREVNSRDEFMGRLIRDPGEL